MDNKQQQEDEVSVLQSIFSDEVEVINDTTLEVVVPIATPQPLQVIFSHPISSPSSSPSKPTDTTTTTTQPTTDTDTTTAPIGVHHHSAQETCSFIMLPPLSFRVELPDEYPSHDPPSFCLSASWLSRDQLSALCKHLDMMWEEIKGEVILFNWISWLREESSAFLSISSPLVLPPYHSHDDVCDERAICSYSPTTIYYMREFDTQMRKQQFEQTNHECGICYADGPGYQFIHQTVCDHTFCRECMAEFCRVHITSGSIDQIKCPEKSCRQQVLPHVIRQLVRDPELYGKYEKLMLERSLSTMDDIMYCPHCNVAVIIDAAQNLGACGNCKFSFCTKCMSRWHPGNPCASMAGLEMNLEKMRKAAEHKKMSEEEKTLMKRLEDEIKSKKYFKSHTKACPSCRTLIEKNDGCNKMTCFQCGIYFCWLCVKQITGYTHFGSSCQLFPGMDADDARQRPRFAFHAEDEHEQMMMQHQVQFLMNRNPNNVKKCPRCKTNNIKRNNQNHMRCWNCKSQFCGVCLSWITGTAHFSAKGCKQHSEE